MARRILRNQKFQEYYLEADKRGRQHLIKGANKDQINSLCEATLNVLNKNVPVDDGTKAALCKHKRAIHGVACKKTSIAKKKKIFQQKGGFLPIILSTVLPLLANAILNGQNG